MYSRIGRRENIPTSHEIKVPENYSGSAFNGGLIGDLDDTLTDDISDKTDERSGSNQNEETAVSSTEESNLKACSGTVSCALPSHMATRGDGQRALWFDDDRLLILGLILLLNNGTVDEDMLVLLILLLL